MTSKNTWMDYSIGAVPLQLRTNSRLGSNDVLVIRFKSRDQEPSLKIIFSDTPAYQISSCTGGPVDFTMSDGEEHVWTVYKRGGSLNLLCEGEQIFNYLFKDSSIDGCAEKFSFVEAFAVGSDDTATDQYRADPRGQSPCFTSL